MAKQKYDPVSPDQLAALRAYAVAAGADWKKKLSADWMRAGSQFVNVDTYTFLHQLRNTHGPRWLAGYVLPTD